MPHSSNWQEALNPPFVQQLLRPLLRPGRVDPRMAKRILTRYQTLTPLPLVTQLTQRQTRVERSAAQPIVYAQPALPQSPIASPSPPQASGAPTIIQAKFVSSRGAADLASPPIPARPEAPSGLPTVSPLDPPNFLDVERSPLSSVNLPDLPLIQPAPPPTPGENLPQLRPRRPRFERDIHQSVANSGADLKTHLADPLSSVVPSLESPATPPLPFATASDRSNALPQPTVLAMPLTGAQNQSTERNLPLVSLGLSPSQENRDRPKSPVVSPQNRAVDSTVAPAALQNPPTLDLPLIQISPSSAAQNRPTQPAGASHPLVFSSPAVSPTRHGDANGASNDARNLDARNLAASGRAERGYSAAELGRSLALPVVSAQPQPAQQPTVDVDALADKVERKLMRRLVVERERRGLKS